MIEPYTSHNDGNAVGSQETRFVRRNRLFVISMAVGYRQNCTASPMTRTSQNGGTRIEYKNKNTINPIRNKQKSYVLLILPVQLSTPSPPGHGLPCRFRGNAADNFTFERNDRVNVGAILRKRTAMHQISTTT